MSSEERQRIRARTIFAGTVRGDILYLLCSHMVLLMDPKWERERGKEGKILC
jgi:hypothetical protein